MTPNQKTWVLARNRLADAVASLGYPEELADLLAKQLGSPRAIDRMAGYLYRARPASMEMIADEMLAICADAEAWRGKKESLEAQERYNAWLRSDIRLQQNDENGGEA